MHEVYVLNNITFSRFEAKSWHNVFTQYQPEMLYYLTATR